MTVRPAVVRRAQYLMIAGLLTSFIGTQVIEGAATGLVALGVLPVIWVPLYATLTDVQDSLAASVAKLVEKRDPGRVLVACEATDVALSLIALALILVLGDSYLAPVLIGYLLIASILPLIEDLAEEFYLNDIAQVDSKLVLQANTIVAVATGVAGMMLARPVGALVSSTGIAVILGINIAFSALAIFLRFCSTATYHPAHIVEADKDEAAPEGVLASIKAFLIPHSPKHLLSFGFLSPLFSFFLSLAPAMIATYVLLWLADSGDRPLLRLGGMMFILGVVHALTPLLIARLMRDRQGKSAARLLTVFLSITLCGYVIVLVTASFLAESTLRFILAFAALMVAGAAIRGVRFAVGTLRQSCLNQSDFRTVVGWSFSMSSIGSIFGSWLGYSLQPQTDPRLALLCATLTMAALVGWVLFKRVSLPTLESTS